MLFKALERYKIPKTRMILFITVCLIVALVIPGEIISILTGDSLLSIIVSVLVILIVMARGLQYYPRKLVKERTLYTSKAFPTISYLVLRYSASESTTESVKEIVNKNLSQISDDFRRILDQIIKGNHPRKVLEKYAKDTPSEVFREGLLSFLSLTRQERIPSKYVLRSFKAVMGQQLREIEIKTTLFVTFLFFLPILILVFVMVNGLPDYYMMIAPMIQIMLAELILYHLISFRE